MKWRVRSWVSLVAPCVVGSACGAHLDASDAGTDGPSAQDATSIRDAEPDTAAATDVGRARSPGFASFSVPGPRDPDYSVEGSVVRDTLTGLVWERASSPVRLTFDAAVARCDALTLDGHDDFRMPTRVELVSLLRTSASPSIHPTFSPTPADYFWTRSLHPRRDTSTTTVYFGAAEIVHALTSDPSAYVRCVRARPEGEGAVREPSGRILDRGTGLVWSHLAPRLSFEDAVVGCEARGARVPTLDELATLIDDTRIDPAIDLATLGGEAGPTWSSSPSSIPGERVGLDLARGPSVRLRERELAWVRCVETSS
ncbi:MAG: hypothetical protein OHK0013_16950 [Sandaracinaceae bacterium]